MLVGQHYQNGYVCDDIEEGIALFRSRGLEKEPTIIPVEQEVRTPLGPKFQKQRISMFWLDGLQYELIQPITDETNVYCHTTSTGAPLRFHHICMRTNDWNAFRTAVDDQDFPVAFEGGGDNLKFIYLDGRSVFGHYLEYVWMTDETWKQLEMM